MVPIMIGTCPDEGCKTVLFFPSRDVAVECPGCGQTHAVEKIKDVKQMQEHALGVKGVLRSLVVCTNMYLKRNTDSVKVNGLSNFHCKLISPLLTSFGMDKVTKKARLLSEITSKPTFDCAVLGDRSFVIEPEHLDTPGYGRDVSGSQHYLADTLRTIAIANGGKELLVPLHADSDGHCLVHAVSRAITGRQLFWHPLRSHLKQHLTERKNDYKVHFQDFINASEWDNIIAEADPTYAPTSDREMHGLCNIHIFGLANILKRPIILLDSLSGIQCSADFAAVFLPALSPVEECKSKNGEINPPIVLAWSSSARNHFLPLVGIKGENLPVIARSFLPGTWGVPNEKLDDYMKFNDESAVVIGGNRIIQEIYIKNLAEAMDGLFFEQKDVHPSLVCDNFYGNGKNNSTVEAQIQLADSVQQPRPVPQHKKPTFYTAETQRALQERRMYRCLGCNAICLSPLSPEWLRPGNKGFLYNMAVSQFGVLQDKMTYNFTACQNATAKVEAGTSETEVPDSTYIIGKPDKSKGVSCTYDAKKNILVLVKSHFEKCQFCNDTKLLRLVFADGSVAYENGDLLPTRSLSNHCQCGFKHWWGGKEYDNPPDMIPIMIKWRGRQFSDTVHWFQYESDPSLNSNVYQVASIAVHKHFPGEFGVEELVQKVVAQILELTKVLDFMKQHTGSASLPFPLLKIFDDDSEGSPDTTPTLTELPPVSAEVPIPSNVASASPETEKDSEPSAAAGSEGPIAVHLQGNGDQCKKIAMTTRDSEPAKDSLPGKLPGPPPMEREKEEEAAKLMKAKSQLKEQQVQYKLRKEYEYQIQLQQRALEMALHAQQYQTPTVFDSADTDYEGSWNYGRYAQPKSPQTEDPKSPLTTPPKLRGTGRGRMVFEPLMDSDRAATSLREMLHLPTDKAKKSSTVRMGPGYSVLAPPSQNTWEPSTNKLISSWMQRADVSCDMSKRLSAFPLIGPMNTDPQPTPESSNTTLKSTDEVKLEKMVCEDGNDEKFEEKDQEGSDEVKRR